MPKKKRKHPRYRPPKKDRKTGGKDNNEQTLTDFQQNPYAFGKTAADVADDYGEADLYAMQQMRLERFIRNYVKELISEENQSHTIKSGDNFSSIAKKYGVTVSQIKAANPGVKPTSLQIDQEINIPDALEKLNADLTVSPELIEWMKYEEGELDEGGKATGEPHLESYDDGAGNLTIGYGRNQKSQRYQTIDKDYAVQLLKIDLSDASSSLKKSTVEDIDETITIPIELTQHQFDALTSIIFNAGAAGYKSSKLHKEYISKGITSGPEFEETFKTTMLKTGFSGLEKRRERELKMFRDGDYESKASSLKERKEPRKGTGKKPKGSGRRLYTDENPKDTVSVEFKSAAAIKRTLAKPSFKRKSHKRQSQIINLIHQRARAAFRNAKDPKVKARLKRAYKYATERKEASKRKTQRMRKRKNELSILEATYGNIDEYVVPMGYSLEKWLKKKKKEKLTNKQYADETTGDKWKVVHGKTRPSRKGKGGRKLKPTKRGSVINKSAKNLSYKKATNLHTAIELSD